MCGIAGFSSKRLKEHHLREMCNRISYRGPDADGYFFENETGLGHRRLSIIDLSDAANQPMFSEDGSYVIIFNGEIYNYQELSGELIAKGLHLRTHSDTEIVLQYFQMYGPEAVHRFIGMFAFAIYHRPSETLHLFRDRVGVKPLHYYWKNGEFYFASELKALIPCLVEKEIEAVALTDFFRFGYIRSPHTIFKHVYKLPPGHYVVLKNNELQVRKYWDVEDRISKRDTIKEDEAVEELEALMTSSFNYRMVADVPVGIFLSGGIDSSCLTAILSKSHSNLKTFSIGFDDDWYNEAPYAKEIAGFLGTDHHEQILSDTDAERVLDQYFSIYDEPFGDSSGIPVFLISQFAKENGCKVVLSADGGDELFGGYGRYHEVPTLYNQFKRLKLATAVVRPGLKLLSGIDIQRYNLQHRVNKLDSLMEALKGDEIDFYLSHLAINSKQELLKILNGESVIEDERQMGDFSFLEKMMLWDFKNYLPDDLLVKVDRASMATSIEAREPFLDHRLVEFIFSLPPDLRIRRGFSKHLLKRVLFGYIPEKYFERRKMGFSIPLFKWFSRKLDKEFEELFTERTLSKINVLDSAFVLNEYKKYLYFKSRNKEYNMLMIWHLYVFVKWWQRWMS
jgi:asparagine synthase (glutamine-hydrolysing)